MRDVARDEFCAGQIRAAEIGAGQVRPGKVAAREIRVARIVAPLDNGRAIAGERGARERAPTILEEDDGNNGEDDHDAGDDQDIASTSILFDCSFVNRGKSARRWLNERV